MSKILVRKKQDGTEVEWWVSEGDFWWMHGLAEQQGIQFKKIPLGDGQHTVYKLTDAEAVRLVSLLEFAAKEVIEPLLRKATTQEDKEHYGRNKRTCEHVAKFTKDGGWEVCV